MPLPTVTCRFQSPVLTARAVSTELSIVQRTMQKAAYGLRHLGWRRAFTSWLEHTGGMGARRRKLRSILRELEGTGLRSGWYAFTEHVAVRIRLRAAVMALISRERRAALLTWAEACVVSHQCNGQCNAWLTWAEACVVTPRTSPTDAADASAACTHPEATRMARSFTLTAALTICVPLIDAARMARPRLRHRHLVAAVL